jgi:NADH-quinone oxidoreductase subunit H
VPLLPVFMIFYISMLAETNRHPFDLPEAEAELVSGYNVEYSAMTFALFFLGEYANMLLMSAFLLYYSGRLVTFNRFFRYYSCVVQLKNSARVVFFIVTRATLPRYRYDQLMHLGWKCFYQTIGYLLSL